MSDSDDNVDTKGAAKILGLSARTLEKWRSLGLGPPWYKLGRRVVYVEAEVFDYKRSQRRYSTSEG